MKRLAGLMIGASMLLAPMLTICPAGASAARPAVVKGHYTVLVHWDGGPPGYLPFAVTLNKNRTGFDDFGDSINWSLNGKNFQMAFSGPNPATFVGTKTKAGFNKESKPGMVFSVPGPVTGTWYAVKQP
jgi:hypothetical protein